MPIYEYQCNKCETIFETLVFSSSREKIECAECGSDEVRKLISAAAGIKVSQEAPIPSPSNCQARGGFS